MPGIFTFIKHPVLYLLESSGTIIPGIEKAVALYFNPDDNQLVCKGIFNSSQNSLVEDIHISSVDLVQKLRQTKKSFQWLSAENLPFEAIQSQKKQLTIFDELEHVVLGIGLINETDGKSDLLYLFLNPNRSNFGLSNSTKPLSTDEKSIIGSLIYNNLKLLVQKQKSDADTLKLINTRIITLQDENVNLKSELEQVKKSYLLGVVEMCNQQLELFSKQYNCKFELSKAAKEKLNGFSGDFEMLRSSLDETVKIAINLNFGTNSDTILLHPWDFQLQSKEEKVNQSNQLNVEERYLKTFFLLDKLENAARRVVTKQEKLTGENLGNACPTPITAPAISDSLRNHHKKIARLMAEYPEKWPIIRNEFRPVINIMQQNSAG